MKPVLSRAKYPRLEIGEVTTARKMWLNTNKVALQGVSPPYIEPPVALIAAFFVLGEPVMPVLLIGGGVILFGAWLVNR